jgi:peptidoglycan hydrolase CwlO-like protein
MISTVGIALIAGLVGFGLGFIWPFYMVQQLKRTERSLNGLLESERLVKETLRKESAMAFQLKETTETELNQKLQAAERLIRQLDSDVLLLQKSNEETEAMFRDKEPEIFELKKKLIEANNTIARLKGQLSQSIKS